MGKANSPVLLERNPGVNQRILREAAAITRKLEDCGIEPHPRYNLEPPFGGKVVSNPPLRSHHTQPPTPDVGSD